MEKKKLSIVNFLWIIPLVLGVIVGIVGINKIAAANSMVVPPMTDEGWFDASSAQSDLRFAGIFMCIFGFAFIGFFGTFITAMAPKIIREAKNKSMLINNFETQVQEKTTSEPKQKKCAYCGSLIKPGETKCPSCGGKDFVD